MVIADALLVFVVDGARTQVDGVALDFKSATESLVGRYIDISNICSAPFREGCMIGVGAKGYVGAFVLERESIIAVGLPVRNARGEVAMSGAFHTVNEGAKIIEIFRNIYYV